MSRTPALVSLHPSPLRLSSVVLSRCGSDGGGKRGVTCIVDVCHCLGRHQNINKVGKKKKKKTYLGLETQIRLEPQPSSPIIPSLITVAVTVELLLSY